LLDIPDSELTPEQKKEKKKQRFLKNTREGKAAAKQKRKESKEKQVLQSPLQ
jgi:actin-related protein 5